MRTFLNGEFYSMQIMCVCVCVKSDCICGNGKSYVCWGSELGVPTLPDQTLEPLPGIVPHACASFSQFLSSLLQLSPAAAPMAPCPQRLSTLSDSPELLDVRGDP